MGGEIMTDLLRYCGRCSGIPVGERLLDDDGTCMRCGVVTTDAELERKGADLDAHMAENRSRVIGEYRKARGQ